LLPSALPSGGAAGDVLTTVDGTNTNLAWTTPSGGGAVGVGGAINW